MMYVFCFILGVASIVILAMITTGKQQYEKEKKEIMPKTATKKTATTQNQPTFIEKLLLGIALVGGGFFIAQSLKENEKTKMVYPCPKCKTRVKYHTERCPNCNSKLRWDF